MKKVFVISVFFYVIASPTFCELTDADLNKIRLIINEELKPIRADIVTLKTQVASLNGRIDAVNGRIGGIEKMMTWLMVIIGVVIGLPQVIMMWRMRKERIFEKQIEALTDDVEALKQQQIVQP